MPPAKRPASAWPLLRFENCKCGSQRVKAALDGAIAAFARRPELAANLWERLLQAVVVQPAPAEDSLMGPIARYDITYQLNEIEVDLLAWNTQQVMRAVLKIIMPCRALPSLGL